MRRIGSKLLVTSISCLLLFTGAGYADGASTAKPSAADSGCASGGTLVNPKNYVEDIANQILKQIDNNPKIKSDQAAAEKLVYDVLKQDVDIKFMSEYIVGTTLYDSASSADQSAFNQALMVLISRLYAKAVMQYNDENIVVYPVRGGYQNSPTVMVSSVVKQSSSSTIPVDYRLHKSCNSWKFYDLGVDGIWALSSFRAQLRPIVQDAGSNPKLADVTAALNKHNEGSDDN